MIRFSVVRKTGCSSQFCIWFLYSAKLHSDGAGDGNSNPRAAHQIIFVSWSARLSFPDVAKRRAIRKDRIGVIF